MGSEPWAEKMSRMDSSPAPAMAGRPTRKLKRAAVGLLYLLLA